jgi:phage pi2 protein 07
MTQAERIEAEVWRKYPPEDKESWCHQHKHFMRQMREYYKFRLENGQEKIPDDAPEPDAQTGG